MLATVHACALIGLDGYIIDVEVDFNPRAQIPTFTIVGLPDAAVRESRERVRAAIKNTGAGRGRSKGYYLENSASTSGEDPMFEGHQSHGFGLQFPNKAYIVNLSPANIPKHGPAYDLAIAVGVLGATDQVPLAAIRRSIFVGELSLDGTVRHTKGVLSMAHAAQQAGFESIYVAAEDAAQAALVEGITVYPVTKLGELVEHLYEMNVIEPHHPTPHILSESVPEGLVDFSAVKGQEHVKRALEIAAGGNHNVLLQGPPGVGKTLLARAIPGILPPLSFEEALEVARIYSVADMLTSDQPLVQTRPFRAPHHTISQAGLVGGGTIPKPACEIV